MQGQRSRTGRDAKRDRVFRPELDGGLETRALLSAVVKPVVVVVPAAVSTPKATSAAVKAGAAATPKVYLHTPKVLTMRGGKGVRIQDGRGGAFNVLIDTGPGTVKAKPRSDGLFDITTYGTNADSELVISPLRPLPTKGTAHTFQPEFGVGREILEVNSIAVTSGKIGAILGYRTANLWGPIVIHNDSPVSRIALNRLMPGATIQTDADLETLDVFTDANLAGAGTGIKVGRDLDWMLIGGDLRIADGATLTVNRDLGLNVQPAKGSDPGGQGAKIEGNVTIGPEGTFRINRNLVGPLTIEGNLAGASRLTVGGNVIGTITVLGTVTA